MAAELTNTRGERERGREKKKGRRWEERKEGGREKELKSITINKFFI